MGIHTALMLTVKMLECLLKQELAIAETLDIVKALRRCEETTADLHKDIVNIASLGERNINPQTNCGGGRGLHVSGDLLCCSVARDSFECDSLCHQRDTSAPTGARFTLSRVCV